MQTGNGCAALVRGRARSEPCLFPSSMCILIGNGTLHDNGLATMEQEGLEQELGMGRSVVLEQSWQIG